MKDFWAGFGPEIFQRKILGQNWSEIFLRKISGPKHAQKSFSERFRGHVQTLKFCVASLLGASIAGLSHEITLNSDKFTPCVIVLGRVTFYAALVLTQLYHTTHLHTATAQHRTPRRTTHNTTARDTTTHHANDSQSHIHTHHNTRSQSPPHYTATQHRVTYDITPRRCLCTRHNVTAQ